MTPIDHQSTISVYPAELGESVTFALDFRGDVVRRANSRVRQLPIPLIMIARVADGLLFCGDGAVLWLFAAGLVEFLGPHFGVLTQTKVG